VAKTSNFPGFGKIRIPPGWGKPCKAGQWNDGVLTASSISLYPPVTSLNNDIPLEIAPDGSGGAFVLTICNDDRFTIFTQGPFALRPISATGKASTPILFGDRSAWVGVVGFWSEAVVVPSGPGRCILAGAKTQFSGFGGGGFHAQRFDQISTPLWNGGNPIEVSPQFSPSRSLGNPNNLVGEADGNEGAILGWLMPNAATNRYTIHVQRISSSGNTVWGLNGISFGAVSGPLVYFQSPWIQLVPDQNGGAIVLAPSVAAGTYEAYAIDSTGALTAGPVTLLTGVPNGWIGVQRLRRAVTDGSGGLFLAYADANNDLHVLRYEPAAGIQWNISLGRLFNPAAFFVYEDGRNGALITSLASTGLLEVRRIAGDGTITWKNTLALQPILPTNSNLWREDEWSRFAQAVPKGDGGAVLVFQFYANRAARPRLHSICFDATGAPVNPEQEITGRPTSQEVPVVIPVGGAAIVAWADDGNIANTKMDVWSQRVGCCPPSMERLQPWPPFGCEIIDFAGFGFDDMILKFPCGNNGLRFGVLPLSRLAVNMRGLDYPGSITNRDVPSPDWIRISFYGLPPKTSVQLFDLNGKLLAEAKRTGEKLEIGSTPHVLTFTPSNDQEDQLLIFSGKSDAENTSIHLSCEWGHGKPPKLLRAQYTGGRNV
jgi:hypothetical protein